MNLIPQSGQDVSASSLDQLTNIGLDQTVDHGLQREIGRRNRQRQSRLAGTRLAQMQLMRLAFDTLGQVYRGLILAPLTRHRPDHLTTENE